MKTVSFSGTCLARAEKVLVTPRITYPYVVRKIHCRFPIGTANLLLLRFYVSRDKDAPSSGEPNGYSMLREHGQVDYIRGEGDEKDLEHEVKVAEGGTYLKVYAVNEDYYDHDIDVQMTIELVEKEQ